MPELPRLAITLGEPAGIGPELAIHLAHSPLAADLIAIGDGERLRQAANRLGRPVTLTRFDPDTALARRAPGNLRLVEQPLPRPAFPGQLDSANSGAVLTSLATAADGCVDGRFDAVLTLPVHKGVINDAGVPFTGHTEFFAARASVEVLMLLVGSDPAIGADAQIRVALATTHLPLRGIADAITPAALATRLHLLATGMRQDFGIDSPRIAVLGLNPHAGESGHLGDEEITVIAPTLDALRSQGLDLHGPLPADTAFVAGKRPHFDAYFAMYHDQGLPVLKALGFGGAVNVTLGLPYVRTSVDHGVALDLAGSGRADPGSAFAAAKLALAIATRRRTPS